MFTRFPFTETRLAKLSCPPSNRPAKDGRAWFYDEAVRGLAFMVTEAGSRSFYYYRRIPGRKAPKRRQLGQRTLVEARREVERMNGKRDNEGTEPITRREALIADQKAKETAPTFGHLWASYRDHHLVNMKTTTLVEFTRMHDRHLAAWDDRRANEITEADVEKLKLETGEAHGHYTANRILALVSAIYRKRGHAFGLPRLWTPTAGVDRFPEMPRDRVLTTDELAKVLAAIDADENATARDYFRMLLYTGMRKQSVATMQWQDLNVPGATWKLAGAKTKNGKPLVVHLIPDAVAILERRYDDNPPDSPFVFPANRITPAQVEKARALRGEGKTTRNIADAMGIGQTTVMTILKPEFVAKPLASFDGAGHIFSRILKRAGITQRTSIHDLRRTFCTALIERGAPLPVVAAAMGHRTLETTNRHYSIASDKVVTAAVSTSLASLLADVAQAGKAQPAKKRTA